MVLIEALGKRWALRLLWELREGPLSFRALRAAADDVSPSVLNTRLAELRELGIVEWVEEGYQLSEAGRRLGPILLQLDTWARAHAKALC